MRRINQQGAASILSVVIFAIIITIVVTAYIRSAIVQQSEAYNFDSSARAYYAAESGIQDAVRAINSGETTSKNTCADYVPADDSNNGVLNSELNLSYSCQLVDTSPSSIAFNVSQSQNATVKLRPVNPANFENDYKLIVRWSSKSQSDKFKSRANVASLTSEANWNDGGVSFHPMLRTSLLHYPLSSPNALIGQKVTFLNPVTETAGLGTATIDFGASVPYSPDNLITQASCYDSDGSNSYVGYLCQEEILIKNLDLNSSGLALRLHSIYGATNVQLSLIDKSGDLAALQGVAAQVDVTGKSGNTLRRVRQTFNLNNGVALDNLPEAAVIGGDGICKNYSITDNSSEFSNIGSCF